MEQEEKRRLSPGDILTLKISKFNKDYWGQARLGRRKKAIVPGALPGEKVEAEVVEVWKYRVLTRLTKVIEASPDRVEAGCPHYATCAGCQFQTLSYDGQLALKKQKVKGHFEFVNFSEPLPEIKMVPSRTPYQYRNSITLHGPGEPGFWQVKGRGMVEVQECTICVDEINAALADQRKSNFSEFLDQGIDNVMLRASNAGEIYVGPELYGDEWETWLQEKITNPLTKEEVTLDVPAHAFWQANTQTLEDLLAAALLPVKEFNADVFIEAYCGIGVFGLMAAPVVKQVVGVEENPRAIEAAEKNIAKLGLSNHRVQAGKTEEYLNEFLAEQKGKRISLLVDPPRSGLSKEVIKMILAHLPEQLVYVSCGPTTFAENLKKLCTYYDIQSMTLVDMFPQTKHIESVAVLSRK